MFSCVANADRQRKSYLAFATHEIVGINLSIYIELFFKFVSIVIARLCDSKVVAIASVKITKF
ncbi:MAG: hypothetical protein IJ211_01685 [Campylobacter sp.]|nr:hypothetical protein [Campylobacter sp.]